MSRTARLIAFTLFGLTPVWSGQANNGQGRPDVGIRYFHSNHIGSSTLITDESAAPVARTVYMPYGDLAEELCQGEDGFRPKFTGKELDRDTHLYYFDARYYDPVAGRFTARDPGLGGPESHPASLNRFAYVGGNPITVIDPTGRKFSQDPGTEAQSPADSEGEEPEPPVATTLYIPLFGNPTSPTDEDDETVTMPLGWRLVVWAIEHGNFSLLKKVKFPVKETLVTGAEVAELYYEIQNSDMTEAQKNLAWHRAIASFGGEAVVDSVKVVTTMVNPGLGGTAMVLDSMADEYGYDSGAAVGDAALLPIYYVASSEETRDIIEEGVYENFVLPTQTAGWMAWEVGFGDTETRTVVRYELAQGLRRSITFQTFSNVVLNGRRGIEVALEEIVATP